MLWPSLLMTNGDPGVTVVEHRVFIIVDEEGRVGGQLFGVLQPVGAGLDRVCLGLVLVPSAFDSQAYREGVVGKGLDALPGGALAALATSARRFRWLKFSSSFWHYCSLLLHGILLP